MYRKYYPKKTRTLLPQIELRAYTVVSNNKDKKDKKDAKSAKKRDANPKKNQPKQTQNTTEQPTSKEKDAAEGDGVVPDGNLGMRPTRCEFGPIAADTGYGP